MTLADRSKSNKNYGLANWTPEPDDPRTALVAIAILKAVKEAYEDAAKIIRERCEDRMCENRCYHEHAIRARAAEVSK